MSQLKELTDMPSSAGHNYASSRPPTKYIGTVDIRSNLYIRPFEQADQRVIKEVSFCVAYCCFLVTFSHGI